MSKVELINNAINNGRMSVKTCIAIDTTKNIRLLKKIINSKPPVDSTCDYNYLVMLANKRIIELG